MENNDSVVHARNKIISLIHNVISNNKWLFNFIESNWKESKTRFKDHDLLKTVEKDLQKIIRNLKPILTWYEGKNIFDLLPEEVVCVKLSGLIIMDDILVKKRTFDFKFEMQKEILRDKGYLFNEYNLNFDTKISFENYVFYNIEGVIKFLFEITELEEIIVTEKFVKQINEKFHANIISARSLGARIERWDFISKIDNNRFKLLKSNEKEIANEIYNVIKKISFNFLNKNLFLLLCSNVIEKYDLKLDEPYYIFKKYFSRDFFFSKGNSMFISKNEKLANMAGSERMKEVYPLPSIISLEQFALDTGLSPHAKVNFRIVFSMGKDNLFIFDDEDEKHINFIHGKFVSFFQRNEGIYIEHSQIKDFCEFSDDEFLHKIKDIYSFKFLNKAFESNLHLKYFKEDSTGKNKLMYFYSEEAMPIINYLDADDWDGL